MIGLKLSIEKKNADVIYFDFLKGFDEVPLNEMMTKLADMGDHPRIDKWMKHFVFDKSFQV